MATIDFVVKNGLTVTEKTTIQSTTDASSSSDTNASLNTAGGSAIAKKLYVGTDFQAGGTTINLGTSAAALTTTTLGGAITGNILKVSSTAAGTINLSTDVTTGIINAFTSLTTGTMNIGTGAGAGTFNIGGPAAVLNIGTTGGDSIIELRANSTTGTATLRTSAGVTTANVFNTVSTTGNLFGAATTISVGTTSGTITLSNPTVVGTQATVNLWNTTSTTVNAFGAATTIGIGAATGTLTIGNITITGTNAATFNMNGTNPSIASSNTGTASLFNANITAINFGQAAAISMGATTLDTTVRGNLLVNGNTTLGDASGDTVTYKANTSYVPNTYTFTLDDAVINNTSYPIKFSHTTSGTAAVGIGTGIQLITENAAGTGIAGSYIESVSTNVTAGAEAFNLVFKTMTSGGTAAQAMSVNNNTLTVGAGSTSTTITTQTSSNLTILPGATGVTSNGTSLTLKAGQGGTTSGNGGAATIGAGDASTLGVGGIATFRSGISVGTNQVGVSTIIEAGNGTGTGGSGDIVFRTAQAGVSGATANTMADRFYIRPSGAIDIVGTMTVSGDLIVNGTTTTVNSTIVSVDDKNIELGSVVAKSGLQATLTLVTAIVNLTTGDTKSLIPGMLLTVNTGPGAFGAAALILTVNSLTQFTASINHSVAGAVTFTAGAATDFTADGGGITIKGDSDKTFTWVKTTNAFSANTKLSGTELISTVAVGTAPLTVTSTTVVTNLNADLLDGQNGSWYNDWANITNKPDPVVTVTLTGDVTGTGTATLTDLASGTASFATTIAANSVAMGTDTTGDYVSSMTAGTGITVGTATGEGSTPVITNTGVTSLVAGNAITISGATGAVTVNHADTSSQASVDNSNGTVIQDVTLDTYGHVTGLASVDLDLRYLGKTAKAADSELLDGYDSTAYQGPVSAVKTFYWAIPQSGNQAKQFEIARVAVDFNDWNSIGAIEIELLEKYYSSGLKKKYTISYGSGPTSTLRLVEYIGVGVNGFRVTVGASVTGTGDQRWIPIYVETVAYAQCDVRLTTNWNQTGTNPPPIGTMFIISSPGAGTNIGAFSPDSVPELTSASSATINGATILTSFAEADTLATVTGRGATTSTLSTFSGGLTANGSVKLPDLGTSGFVKLGAGGVLSADTSTYLTAEADTLATVTGRGFITRASSTAFATGSQGTPGLEVYGAGGVEPSYLTFHRPGQYAIKLGLDGSDLKVGGWSMGAVGYRLWHEGNITPLTAEADTLATVTGRGATTTTVPSFNGGGRFLAPNDEFFSFTNVDSDSTHYTSRSNRLLTSNGTNWVSDGKDAVIAITRSSAATTRGGSIGLTLHNENSTTNAYSPAITFSARSDSGNYNSMYAAIMGKKTGMAGGSGADNNWNRGELHFYTVGGYYVGDVPTMVLVGTSTSTGGVGIGTTTVNSGYSLDIRNDLVLARMESTTGANSALFVIKNTAGSTIFGNQGSVASTFTGAYNYATVFGTDSARALQFATNNEVRFEANSAGTFSVYKNSFMVGETYGGLSIGESPTNYNGWDRQLNVHGTGNARIHVKTGTVNMGMYAHDAWQAVSGTTPGGFVGTYNSYPLSFLVNALQVGVFNTSGFFGVGTASPVFKLSVNTAADVWHAQFGTSGGKQLRIGGSTTNGSVIGAYNNDGNSSPASLLLNRDGGNVGIGTSAPVYTLQVVGSFAATTKSFVIDHPTKPGMKLRYGSLEGPENGVYVRGRLKGNTIELPEYWTKLVDPDSITVNLTPIGKHQNLYVLCIKDNVVHIENSGLFPSKIDCFYTVYGERVDVEKLVVEIE